MPPFYNGEIKKDFAGEIKIPRYPLKIGMSKSIFAVMTNIAVRAKNQRFQYIFYCGAERRYPPVCS
jgi:hypothetical protein